MDNFIFAIFVISLIITALSISLCIALHYALKMLKNANSAGSVVESGMTRLDSLMRDEFARSREEYEKSLARSREEFEKSLARSREASEKSSALSREEQSRELRGIREEQSHQLKEIRDETAKKLDEMRKTVDENLKDAVEKRFNDSFKIISDRLELVHQGLGEMKQLAVGVGDLKKVLTNVKTRGILGEIQLGAILTEILSPEQFAEQFTVKNNAERVDFVVKLPDKNSLDGTLLLPIDSKFPTEDYIKLIEAYETGVGIDIASKQFETAVKKNARDIRDKYINPPVTTDFAVMFVPTEGLYAEIVRRTELFAELQNTLKVTVVGPTNLSAFLSSLQMGFRTLAIERRSSEVWVILGAVKTEFEKFGGVFENIKKKIDSVYKEIDQAGVRSRQIERKLKDVSETSEEDAEKLLGKPFDE
ncbi:DNA recombination protein RmuC [Clostridia bacterium]|nr:DNA recombination protein RmuC [Clostridia bacterium]